MIRRKGPTFDSRVVLFNEMALDEPHRQSGLAHSYPHRPETQGRDLTRQSFAHENAYRERMGGSGRETLTTATDEDELVFA